MPDPSVNKFQAILNSSQYKHYYRDLYPLKVDGKINPLTQCVPALELVDNPDTGQQQIPPFFGPYVLNIIAFTGPFGNDDKQWEDTEETIEVIKKAYPKYALYETHMLIDKDAEGAQETSLFELEGIAEGVCASLSQYGFFWHGTLATAELDQKITDIITEFQEKLKLL